MVKSTLAPTLAFSLISALTASAAVAEVKEVALGQQFGAVYLPPMVMEHEKLVEKQLAAAGLNDVKVTWAKLGGPAALNDALLSGTLHFSAQGVPSTAVIWDRTKAGIGVKSLGALASNNIWLNTKDPTIKSLKDFTDKHRIGVPSLKVSTQALGLHYASEQLWGQYSKLDHLVVAIPHPEAMAAVLNPTHEITAHFATSPFHEIERKAGLKTITTFFDIMGGPTTGLNFVSSEKFRTENPKIFAAVSKAFEEAFTWINTDKPRAVRLYIEVTKDRKLTEQELLDTMAAGDLTYTRTPSNVGKIMDFMHRVGLLKTKAASWKDLYFSEVHSLPGS